MFWSRCPTLSSGIDTVVSFIFDFTMIIPSFLIFLSLCSSSTGLQLPRDPKRHSMNYRFPQDGEPHTYDIIFPAAWNVSAFEVSLPASAKDSRTVRRTRVERRTVVSPSPFVAMVVVSIVVIVVIIVVLQVQQVVVMKLCFSMLPLMHENGLRDSLVLFHRDSPSPSSLEVDVCIFIIWGR